MKTKGTMLAEIKYHAVAPSSGLYPGGWSGYSVEFSAGDKFYRVIAGKSLVPGRAAKVKVEADGSINVETI